LAKDRLEIEPGDAVDMKNGDEPGEAEQKAAQAHLAEAGNEVIERRLNAGELRVLHVGSTTRINSKPTLA
jgi:hypothetical protein